MPAASVVPVSRLLLLWGLLVLPACKTVEVKGERMYHPVLSRASGELTSIEESALVAEPVTQAEAESIVQMQTPAPTVTVEVSSSTISAIGKLTNSNDKPLVLYWMPVGYGDSPFEAYLTPSDIVQHIPIDGPWPVIPERILRVTIPPKTIAMLRSQIDLHQFTYHGQPEGVITWVLQYANRTFQRGEISVRLPLH